MLINGFIIQKKKDGLYQGVEGDNWYLNYCSNKEMDIFFEENIEKAWQNSDYVDVCEDIEYIKKYIELSENKEINYRILACITEKKMPQTIISSEVEMEFLGYDYAYAGGSYYSAILNDLISNRIKSFTDIQLNNFGLFGTYEEVRNFINRRRKMQEKDNIQEEYLEKGDYIIYELYEVNIKDIAN